MSSWRIFASLKDSYLGSIANNLASLEAAYPQCLPDFAASETVYCFSDYSGELKSNKHQTYSFLLIDDRSLHCFATEHKKIRYRYKISKRKFSYKDLSDKTLRAPCDELLNLASKLNGVLLTVAINKKLDLSFQYDDTNTNFLFLTNQKKKNIKRMLIISHLAGFFVASIIRPMHNIIWITDNDNIVANDNFTRLLTNMFASIVGSLVDFQLKHVRCGSSCCDYGDNLIEDLLSIPDFAAGVLANQMDNQFFDEYTFAVHQGVYAKEKQNKLSWWLADTKSSLRKYIFILDPGSTSEKVTTSFFHFYGQHKQDKKI